MASPRSYIPNIMNDLSGKISLVTGGGTGIGLMIAQGLAVAGSKVYIAGRRLDVLENVSQSWDKQMGGEIRPLQLDITDKTSIVKAKEHIKREDGKLHILVNNAGQVGPTATFMRNPSAPERKDAETLGNALFNDQTFQEWADLYAVDTSSIYFVTMAFLGLLAKGSEDDKELSSSVVNITSISGVMKLSQAHFCYNSAKAAASHLTKILATEFALNGVPVRVNSIAPGVFPSEMTKEKISPEEADKIGGGIQPIPARRAGVGQEMAGTVVYLVSRAGGYVNGQEIVVDGGFVAVNPSTV